MSFIFLIRSFSLIMSAFLKETGGEAPMVHISKEEKAGEWRGLKRFKVPWQG